MSEIPQEQLQSTENVDIQDNNNQKNSTIENVLKQKLPNNTERQEFFAILLNKPEIQSSFTQEEIIKYIQENPISSQYRTLKTKSPEEQIQTILEDMDIQIKNDT